MFKKKISIVLLITSLFLVASLGMIVPNEYSANSIPKTSADMTYYNRFMDMFNDIQTKGYLSPEGIPYHTIETLLVEAPDYGHLTTSEAFSFLTWLGATYGKLTGDWSYYKDAWETTENYIIPQDPFDQPGTGTYPPDAPAQYAPEGDLPSDYPVNGDASAPTGVDPIFNDLRNTYGTGGIYQMHWLLDVDNWYGYGNHGDGTSRASYINTYQRGPQESVWETVPHPSWEDFSWGAGNEGGFLPLFGEFGAPTQQWRYTSASDADARQVQASYWAQKWAEEQGVAAQISDESAKAAKMGDYLRYTMFDKYFRPIDIQSNTAGTGYDSAHYLMSWYASWGGDVGGAWSWRIGSSHSHQGYQNVMAAYALTTEASMRPQSSQGYGDWEISLDRQLDLYEYLQSAEGAIAGGVTNSWAGRYDPYPSGISTFYEMAYDWQPVYHDPPSNSWFGFQCWSMERVVEYYLETGSARAKAICEKWVNWAIDNVILNSDGTYQIPSTLEWEGQPDTWAGTPTGNPSLHVTVEHGAQFGAGVDIGISAALAKILIKYAAATEEWDGVAYEPSKTTGKEIIDRMWTLYRDDKGVACPESRPDYSRFNDEVYIPTNYNGVNAQGATIENGMTFIEMRPKYLEDPDWAAIEATINAGQDPEMTYHRFWAQADVAMANAIYHIYFAEDDLTSPTINQPTDVSYLQGSTGNSISWTATDDNPTTYTVTRDGTQVSSDSWISGSPITVSVDGLSEGSYDYVIIVNDGDVQSTTDTVVVVVTTEPTSGGNVWFSTESSQSIGNVFTTDIYVDTGTQNLAAYGFEIIWDQNILIVQGDNSGVAEGADGFLAAVNVENSVGTMMISGFEATGVGPNNQLHLLTITWEAVGEGTTILDLTIETLVDSSTSVVGTPTDIDGSVTVAQFLLGDVNHDDVVNIVDALLVSQYDVGIDPQPFYSDQADVNEDNSINIIDALLIAQYYVGVIPSLPPPS
ncbi:MAG: cellulose 1,4-beta-cellobiosidase [Candidatus Lokiarchaeota archaeon]|nr:cellulose 1,4-beta-cellobiosidase [Candidatus Lokiarchaeota archaeon]